MKVTTNNGAGDVARAFNAQAELMQLKGDCNHYSIARCYGQAAKWFRAARGMTIGHNKSARYDEAAERAEKKRDEHAQIHADEIAAIES